MITASTDIDGFIILLSTLMAVEKSLEPFGAQNASQQ